MSFSILNPKKTMTSFNRRCMSKNIHMISNILHYIHLADAFEMQRLAVDMRTEGSIPMFHQQPTSVWKYPFLGYHWDEETDWATVVGHKDCLMSCSFQSNRNWCSNYIVQLYDGLWACTKFLCLPKKTQLKPHINTRQRALCLTGPWPQGGPLSITPSVCLSLSLWHSWFTPGVWSVASGP